MRSLRHGRIVLAVLLTMISAGQARATTIHVQQKELSADIIYPDGKGAHLPAVLVLGGAEGGNRWAKSVAQDLASHGYVAMAEAYFNAPGLPQQLLDVPLERFKAGIDRLARDARVDRRRIAVLGLSKGAEAALLIAGRDHRIRAVVAGSPSDVVWQGIDRKNGAVASSWTEKGVPLPFVAFAACTDCKTLVALYKASHDTTLAESARIPVETIHAPLLLLSSEADTVWPSQTMAAAILSKRTARRSRDVVLDYPDGGHFTLGPPAPADAQDDVTYGGGTKEGVIAAREAAWPKVLSFLGNALHAQPHR